ncbi:MAG: hypothetical protein ACRC0S_06545, partial [Fusobacteriaceae bacterium]
MYALVAKIIILVTYLILQRQKFVKNGKASIQITILIIGFILVLSTGLLPTDREREVKRLSKLSKILEKHLEKRYNEEFKIWNLSGRLKSTRAGEERWDEGWITPKRFVGTRKESDRYYDMVGFIKNGKVGDTYGNVLIREGANEYYGAKLKELFGENILPILEVKGMSSEVYSYEIPDYKK